MVCSCRGSICKVCILMQLVSLNSFGSQFWTSSRGKHLPWNVFEPMPSNVIHAVTVSTPMDLLLVFMKHYLYVLSLTLDQLLPNGLISGSVGCRRLIPICPVWIGQIIIRQVFRWMDKLRDDIRPGTANRTDSIYTRFGRSIWWPTLTVVLIADN